MYISTYNLSGLFEKYGVVESDFLSAELCAVPAYPARAVGLGGILAGTVLALGSLGIVHIFGL